MIKACVPIVSVPFALVPQRFSVLLFYIIAFKQKFRLNFSLLNISSDVKKIGDELLNTALKGFRSFFFLFF